MSTCMASHGYGSECVMEHGHSGMHKSAQGFVWSEGHQPSALSFMPTPEEIEHLKKRRGELEWSARRAALDAEAARLIRRLETIKQELDPNEQWVIR